jgi:hypothetical protein
MNPFFFFIPMPGYKLLKAAAAGLARDYVRYHGPHSLAPVRAEPMKFFMVRDMCNVPTDGRAISAFSWTDTSHEVFVFRRLIRVLIFSGLRLGEIVGNGSGEVTYITLDCVAWRIDGVIVKNPTAAQLNSLQPGRDAAIVSPPRSKPDQWGEIHCPFPMIFTFDDRDPINAASAVRDIELRYGVSCSRRDTTPLFATRLKATSTRTTTWTVSSATSSHTSTALAWPPSILLPLVPLGSRHSTSRCGRRRLNDHADLQVDVPGEPPCVPAHGHGRTRETDREGCSRPCGHHPEHKRGSRRPGFAFERSHTVHTLVLTLFRIWDPIAQSPSENFVGARFP